MHLALLGRSVARSTFVRYLSRTVPSGWSFGKSSEAAEKPDRQINPIEKKEEEIQMEKGEVKMPFELDKDVGGERWQFFPRLLGGITWQY